MSNMVLRDASASKKVKSEGHYYVANVKNEDQINSSVHIPNILDHGNLPICLAGLYFPLKLLFARGHECVVNFVGAREFLVVL